MEHRLRKQFLKQTVHVRVCSNNFFFFFMNLSAVYRLYSGDGNRVSCKDVVESKYIIDVLAAYDKTVNHYYLIFSFKFRSNNKFNTSLYVRKSVSFNEKANFEVT